MRIERFQDLRVHIGRVRLLALVLNLLWCDTQAWAENKYEFSNTGIESGGGCWVDDTHFVVVKGHQPSGSAEFDVEGLYYFDPSKPQDLKRIDLSPIEPSMQRAIRDVSCQEQTVLFDWLDRKNKVMRVYGLKLGQAPELFAEMRGATTASISLKGRYILGNKLTVEKGVWEEHADCNVRQIKPGFRALCWPKKFEHWWPLPDSVLTEYRRDDIKTRDSDGKIQMNKYPAKPLLDVAGQPVKFALFLRNLDGGILRQVPLKTDSYRLTTTFLKPDLNGEFVYAPCFAKADHDPQYSNFGRVCRLVVRQEPATWEAIFTVQDRVKEDADIQELSVNSQGDVAFVFRGQSHKRGIWLYHSSGKAKVLHRVTVSFYDEWPMISPNGKFIVFSRKGRPQSNLHLARVKEE